ncbi:hypothetical protein ACRBU7_27270 (plasmid) [Priestia aryabhattai]|uniref:hypothetical protein n=1 Tax=Priestia aryabhattai TaxID=412384 RepID=UPI003D7F7473
MGTRVSYPVEVMVKSIGMRLAGMPVKEVPLQLNICNHNQLKTLTWWCKIGKTHQL